MQLTLLHFPFEFRLPTPHSKNAATRKQGKMKILYCGSESMRRLRKHEKAQAQICDIDHRIIKQTFRPSLPLQEIPIASVTDESIASPWGTMEK